MKDERTVFHFSFFIFLSFFFLSFFLSVRPCAAVCAHGARGG